MRIVRGIVCAALSVYTDRWDYLILNLALGWLSARIIAIGERVQPSREGELILAAFSVRESPPPPLSPCSPRSRPSRDARERLSAKYMEMKK